ncbi:MAG: enoyl-CoA hydratase-related protein [Peptococcaceae bacterium]|jgi:enoyl-CoA hydratase|nr:enoyl-CoA hydratase-related protein [Peptococcaceae bacterium]
MDYQDLKVTRRDHVGCVAFNRPEALNALGTAMARELPVALRDLAADEDVFAAVLTGEGDRAFCVGADLKERKTMTKAETARQRELFVRAFTAVVEFEKPLVAAVNGFCLGGGLEFALACDFIIAGDTAVFGLPEVGLAIIPGGGGTQLLPRVVGRAAAKELIFTGRRFGAAEALHLRLVNQVVAAGEVMEKTFALARQMAAGGPIALKQAKKAINLGVEVELRTALSLEAECYNACLYSEDRDEGLRAFNEKRPPVYRGR